MISFPKDVYKEDDKGDFNPSIRLFGRRFANDQQLLDFVAEFLLIVASPKKIFSKFNDFLPSMVDLARWREEEKALWYMPKVSCRFAEPFSTGDKFSVSCSDVITHIP